MPQSFDCVPLFLDGDRVEIAPGETEDIRVALVWELGPNPPPAIAFVKAFATIDGYNVRTPSLTFLMQSVPGQFDAAIANGGTAEQNAALLELLRSFDGRRSVNIMRLLAKLEPTR